MEVYKKNLCFIKNYKSLEIPFFQRHYVWETENWERLISEWEFKNTHFLGSIILESISSPSGQKARIIDGQQRLTTLSLLYKALYDIKLVNTKDEIEKEKLMRKSEPILYSSDSVTKILHSCNDKDNFEKILNNKVSIDDIILDNEVESINKIKRKEAKTKGKDFMPVEASNCLYQCYKYFYQYFLKNKNYLDKFWEYLNQDGDEANALFAVITIDQEDEPQKIFDCLNSAGVPLTEADIIKNSIFECARKKYNNDEKTIKLYKERWESVFETAAHEKKWIKTVTTGRIKRNNIELFLYSYAVIKDIHDPDESKLNELSNSYKNYINSKIKDKNGIENLINDIYKYALVYRDSILLFDKTEEMDYNDAVNKLLLVLEEADCKSFYPYILKLFVDSYNYKSEILEISEKAKSTIEKLIQFIISANICKDQASIKNYNKDSSELAKQKIKLDKYISNRIKSDKSRLTKANFEIGLQYFRSDAMPRLILFLLELKNRMSNKSKYEGDERKLRYTYTLEHIMPQKWEEHWGFDIVIQEKAQELIKKNGKKTLVDIDYGDKGKTEIRKEAIYEIGNMLLLKLGKNVKNSNYLLSLNKIKGKNKWDILKNNPQEFIWNDDFIKDFKKKKKWNERIIRERTNRLSEQIIKLFSII